MTRHRRSEYLVLRRTIAARGALRPVLALGGLTVWAALFIAVVALLPFPVAAAIPLLVLVATFEVIRPVHFGAERIGRYLQVFHEEAGEPGRALADTPSWERVAMNFGVVPGVGGPPLFVPLFLLAAALNCGAVPRARGASGPGAPRPGRPAPAAGRTQHRRPTSRADRPFRNPC